MFNQAASRGIRVPNQATIREAGEQGGTVALSYFLAGATARGLSWSGPHE